MTGREWQHGLFLRDRWNVSNKLTLDLGVRWEYYPIMHRADRGIERLDLTRSTCCSAACGGNPNNVGLTASKNNFAPRIGTIYRMNENTVFRTGYGVTYNPIGVVAPDARLLPGDDRERASVNNNTFQPYGSINQGIPLFTGPDLSSGRVPLPTAVDMRTPEPGNIDRGTLQSWNLFVERRLPIRSRSISATSGPRATAAMRTSTSTRRRSIGGGNAGRPMFASTDATAT